MPEKGVETKDKNRVVANQSSPKQTSVQSWRLEFVCAWAEYKGCKHTRSCAVRKVHSSHYLETADLAFNKVQLLGI